MKSTSTDELLARVPLFSGLSKKDLREVSNLTTRLDLPAGHELMHQGGLGREFVIVLEGTVDVVIDGEIVAQCGAGRQNIRSVYQVGQVDQKRHDPEKQANRRTLERPKKHFELRAGESRYADQNHED